MEVQVPIFFDWQIPKNCPEPLFEGIMNSTKWQQGLSFTTQAKRLLESAELLSKHISIIRKKQRASPDTLCKTINLVSKQTNLE